MTDKQTTDWRQTDVTLRHKRNRSCERLKIVCGRHSPPCGRRRLLLGPLSFVAVIAVAVMVCGRHGIESYAQMAEDVHTVSFAYDSPMSLPECVKIWLISVNHFLPNFCPKVIDPPMSISASETFNSKLRPNNRDGAVVTMKRLYRKPPTLIRMVPSLTPMTFSSPKWGYQMHPRTNIATRAATTWRIW